MSYDFHTLEKKWQQYWSESQTFRAEEDPARPKFYILDMFPYPSGAGLHVGHPLGFIATDIYARYKRLKGYNVLHPMGYDAFGLPAEQYALETGQAPAVTTQQNITRYRQQMDLIGLARDWNREVQTCRPEYYHWTQWVFLKMFDSYYDIEKDRACPLQELIERFEREGNGSVRSCSSKVVSFSAQQWQSFDERERDKILGAYRLAYRDDLYVNWCPNLETVLANDEVADGLSVRGGHRVVRKKMKQWSLRVSAYAHRLLEGLDGLDWNDSIKEIQRHWIGRSEGAEVNFEVKGTDANISIFTTRPDTLFGVTFMVLAPESEWVGVVVADSAKNAVDEYVALCQSRSDRQREAGQGEVSGVFTGAYALHPINGQEIPIWVGDYVLGEYGTGAIMAVPAHDERDHAFARHFDLPIVPVITPPEGFAIEEAAWSMKEGVCMNSDMLNGLEAVQGAERMCLELEERGQGTRRINYRLRDAIFSRQRYWGEPFPIYYREGVPHPLKEEDLPLVLPAVESYRPTESGEPPLARLENWTNAEGLPLETATMPGFAGSSAYFLRYMDPHNDKELCSKQANGYWQDVDIYLGGSEHATGHLVYARFWNMFLYDYGLVCREEPFKKLINQGMIQGRSNFVYRLKERPNTFVSHGLKGDYDVQEIHVDVSLVNNDILDREAFQQWRLEFAQAEFILEDGNYRCGHAIEKMSKSLYNVVNPDDVISRYGADTFRLYEMFLGPIEQSKPWSTQGIEGVSRFLNRFWNLFHAGESFTVTEESPTSEELKILHTCIKKVSLDVEALSFNTAISALMIAANELGKEKCRKREILHPLVLLLSPFAPHLCEELHQKFGNTESVVKAKWPEWDEALLVEETFPCPVSFNGKKRLVLIIDKQWRRQEVEEYVLKQESVQPYIGGKEIKKIIYVPGKIINFVL